MTRVYGGCVEPGGFVLDNDVDVIECPSCGGEALSRFWETCEGGAINLNHTIICTECDHAEGDLPDSYFDEPIKDDARDAEIEALLADLSL
jgi:5-methylcytosine-specific restriction endonuclease McrA